ncbi:MAG TPA: hypothetical protein VNX47_13235 [Nevskia sp.]|jgi:hypothetical protein|nr:hypothetical protein [Nevskia sp.]
MSLAIDFTSIPRLLEGEFRLPAGDFLPTSPLRTRGESVHSTPDHDFQPSYRTPDCVSALGAAFRHPLAGMFAPGLAQ